MSKPVYQALSWPRGGAVERVLKGKRLQEEIPVANPSKQGNSQWLRQSCAKCCHDTTKCPETSAKHVGDKHMVFETAGTLTHKGEGGDIVRSTWQHVAALQAGKVLRALLNINVHSRCNSLGSPGSNPGVVIPFYL